MKNGMAMLEEWLQEKYVEYYNEADRYTNKQELLSDKKKDLFLKDGSRNYIINGAKAYYLINKSSLPKEIKESLVGGDTTEYAKYTRLIDVYGVTEDLKVYYCNSENNTTYGNVEVQDVDLNQPIPSINENPLMKEMLESELDKLGVDVGEDGITTGNALAIKDNFVVDGAKYNLNSLNELSNLKNLRSITIKDLTLDSLDGLQGCPELYYIYFKNCDIKDYTILEQVLKLQYLYFYLLPEMEKDVANRQIIKLGEGLKNASGLDKLEYFGISGEKALYEGKNDYSITWSDGSNKTSRKAYDKHFFVSDSKSKLDSLGDYSLENKTGLANFNETIKKNLSYIDLMCNNISSIEVLKDFSDIEELTLNCNSNLKNLSGLENHSSINRLAVHNCGLTSISSLTGVTDLQILTLQTNPNLTSLNGIDNDTNLIRLLAYDCDLTDITSLTLHKTNLEELDLHNNVNLVNIIALKNCVALKQLYLAGNIKMNPEDVSNALADDNHIYEGCKPNHSIPGIFLSIFTSTGTSFDYSYENYGKYLENDSIDFVALKNKTQITRLSLKNQKNLTNDKLQEILSTLPNLEYISLWGCSNLSSLNFIKGVEVKSDSEISDGDDIVTEESLKKYKNPLRKIVELDVRGTRVSGSGLEILDNYCSKMRNLVVSCTDITPSNLQNLIKQLGAGDFQVNLTSSWLGMYSWQIRGLCVVGLGAESTIDFSGCDLSNVRFVSIGCSNKVVFDFSGVESLGDMAFGWCSAGVVLPSLVKGECMIGYSRSAVDFSHCETIAGLKLQYCSWEKFVYPSSPISLTSYCNIYRGPFLGSLNFGRLFDLNSNLISFKLGMGGNQTKSDGGSIINGSLGDFSEPCFKNLTIQNVWFESSSEEDTVDECLTIDITGKTYLKLYNVYGSKKLRFIGTNSQITNLNINETDFTSVEGLSNFSNLTDLVVAHSKLTKLDGVESLTHLVNLDLSNNNIIDLSNFARLVTKNGEGNVTNQIALRKLLLNKNNLSKYNTSDSSDNETILCDFYDAGLRQLNLSDNNFAKGQLDRVAQKFGQGLTINYIS